MEWKQISASLRISNYFSKYWRILGKRKNRQWEIQSRLNMKHMVFWFYISNSVHSASKINHIWSLQTQEKCKVFIEANTDLCILKVIIYRVLQLSQFLLLFLLFLFLLLCQSSLSLLIIVVLVFLWFEGNKTRHDVKGQANRYPTRGLPTTDSMPQTLELQEFLHGRYMFWLLLTCTAPDDNEPFFFFSYHFTSGEISIGNT